jgi:hypothetical protein
MFVCLRISCNFIVIKNKKLCFFCQILFSQSTENKIFTIFGSIEVTPTLFFEYRFKIFRCATYLFFFFRLLSDLSETKVISNVVDPSCGESVIDCVGSSDTCVGVTGLVFSRVDVVVTVLKVSKLILNNTIETVGMVNFRRINFHAMRHGGLKRDFNESKSARFPAPANASAKSGLAAWFQIFRH